MGFYINPKGTSKEQFLKEKGVAVPRTFKWSDTPKGSLPVVLVDNGPFTAAAIGYCQREFEGFMDPNDRRPKQVYTVRIDDLVADGDDPSFNELVKDGEIAA